MMKSSNKFNKNQIVWQCTVVKFRNGKLGIAINDERYPNDPDGAKSFIVYDKESHRFTNSRYLNCYNDDLTCNLSTSGITKRIDAVINSEKPVHTEDLNPIPLYDTDWDIIAVNIYPYATHAFQALTGITIISWLYEINQLSQCSNTA